MAHEYDLRRPRTAEEWNQYHEIRRRVLWERRGQYGVYDVDRPDEHKSGNHPLILTFDDIPVGVVRIDISGKRAIFRRVAIRETVQRAGHGRVLMTLAEAFASKNGCDHSYSFVSPDAVGFYEKCGFQCDPDHPGDAKHVPMEKRLKKPAE